MKPYRVFSPVGVFHEDLMDTLVYKNQYELMYSLARFQEFYENPILRGKCFSRLELQAWQPDYYNSWNGCNFPSSVVAEFKSGNWKDLDSHEIEALNNMTDGKYIIGVHLESDILAVMKHERCHALYSFDPDYRKMTDRFFDLFVKNYSDWEVPKILMEAGYGENVIKDEFQAYLVDESNRFFETDDEMYRDIKSSIKTCFSKQLKLED